jgi:thiol-disulfide isomerase/thioredoxin
MPNKSLPLMLATCLAAMLLLGGCKSSSDVPKTTGAAAAAPAPAPAPEAKVALPGLDGTDATVAQYKGSVVLVNFWATWCKPCQEEIPWLIEFNEKYGPKGLVILGVAMDEDGKKVVEPWVKTQHFSVNGQSEIMNYRILLGTDKITDEFGGLIGLPTSMLYSRDGKKVRTIIGEIKHDDMVKAIESQL